MKAFLLLLLISVCLCSLAQQRTHFAVRTEQPPKIDGKLNDSCWQTVTATKDFLTNEPVFGKPATQKTEVKVLYDNDALYLAYYLFDDNPAGIIKLLAERDKTVIADEMMVGIDSYSEKTQAFRFQVSAAGVQADRLQSPFIPSADRSWDAVWESAVTVDDKGWYVEIKIPFSAIRFPNKPVQEWTIQFGRYVGRTGEFTTWSPVNPNIGGGAMRQWGLLKGIENIKPKIRLSVSPYITTGLQSTALINKPDGNSFSNKIFYAGGMDLKYGINQSYTLDMSLIPDFSQVQSDNTVLNLSPFEVRYDERRQFFTEGMDMFSKAGIFYSRRIGSTPSGYYSLGGKLQPDERIMENPTVARLINATKVSGRNNKGLGMGILNALTRKMYATVVNDSTGNKRKILTEPLTNYNVLVLDQSLKNNSKIGFINTNVLRSGNNVNANVSAVDVVLNSKGNIYSFAGTGIYAYRKGVGLPGGKQQGYNYRLSYAKVSGNFRFEVLNKAVQKNFNPNDLGIWGQTNYMSSLASVKYYSYIPKGKLLNWNASFSYTHSNVLDDFSFQRTDMDWSCYFLFKKFSSVSFLVNWIPNGINDIYEPRVQGKLYKQPASLGTLLTIGTDSRKKSQLKLTGGLRQYQFPDKHFYHTAGINPSFRIGNRSFISFSSIYSNENNNQGYVSSYGSDSIVFGLRRERIIENILQLQYLFSPYSNVSFRIRDYSSKVAYKRFFKLRDDGRLEGMSYSKNADIHLNLFNIDLIYTWQFSPGSFLSISWKNDVNFDNKNRNDNYLKNFSNALNVPHNNSISIRIIYYLDYLRVKNIFSDN
ncbi:MAG TPA: DUF5916 domain-containing protein [Chitinophagaceae bacterium]|nr:DUF5916 domain-containing protein [Chitinophagaceae bacterium]